MHHVLGTFVLRINVLTSDFQTSLLYLCHLEKLVGLAFAGEGSHFVSVCVSIWEILVGVTVLLLEVSVGGVVVNCNGVVVVNR